MPSRLFRRAGVLAVAFATAALAGGFLAAALFLLLQETELPAWAAALIVGALLAGAAYVLLAETRRAAPPSTPRNAPHGATPRNAPQAADPPANLSAGDVMGLARWVVQERPVLAIAACLTAGYVLVRHPKTIAALISAASAMIPKGDREQ